MRTEYIRSNKIIVPTGDTLADELNEVGMSQRELAQRLDMSTKAINEIVNGTAPITPETATKLENVLGISAVFWLNLEAINRVQKIKQERLGVL